MNIYRVSVPARIFVDVPAESEEQAIRIAVTVTQTPADPIAGDVLDVLTLWGPDNVRDTLDVDIHDVDENPDDVEEVRQELLDVSERLGNREEVEKAMREVD
jgi:ABC-type transporter Mla subunit MlaD